MYLISSIINKKKRETWLWYPQNFRILALFANIKQHHYRREQLCNGKSQLKSLKDSFALVVSWNILYLYIVKRHHQYVLGWWYAWFVSITTLAGIRDILSLYLFHSSGVSAILRGNSLITMDSADVTAEILHSVSVFLVLKKKAKLQIKCCEA